MADAQMHKLFIIGITGMRMWIKDNMKILVFDDTHTLEYECNEHGIDVGTFIERLKQLTENIIDVFAEIDYLRIGVYEERIPGYGFLSKTMRQFPNHTSIDKSLVKHDNLRFHYGDMRGMFEKKYNMTKFLSCLTEMFYGGYIKDTLFEESTYIPSFNDVFYIARASLKDPKLIKQKSKVDADVSRAIEDQEFIYLMAEKMKARDYKAILDNIIAHKDDEEYVKKESAKIFNSVTSLLSVPGDSYVMARLFSNTLNIKRAILYFGSWHIHRYEKILENLGFRKVVSFNTSDKVDINNDSYKPICLDISDFDIGDFLY
jgi:hypothetical protein